MKTLGDRLKEARIKRKLSQTALSEKSGVPQQTIHAIENKKAKSTSHLFVLAKALHIKAEWLALGEGEMVDSCSDIFDTSEVTISVYNLNDCLGVNTIENAQKIMTIVVGDHSVFGDMNLSEMDHGIFAVHSDSSSMIPTIPPRSLVFVDRKKRELGDGVFLVQMENATYVKRLQRLPDQKLKVVSDNKLYEPFEIDLKKIDNFKILGKVIQVWISRPV